VIGAEGIGSIAKLAAGGENSNSDVFPDKAYGGIMGLFILILSFAPNLSKAWFISAIGLVGSILIACYGVFGSSYVISKSNDDSSDVSYDRPAATNPNGNESLEYAMTVVSEFGSIIFSFGYPIVIPNIQASLHDHSTVDCNRDMKKANTAAYSLSYPSLMLTAILGYVAFGSTVNSNFLLSLNNYLKPAAMYVIWIMLILKAGAEASIFNQSAFALIRDMVGLTIETDHVDHMPKNKYIDAVIRIVWVSIATIIAIFVPIFQDLAAIAGAIAVAPLCFILPIIMWNKKHEGQVSTRKLMIHRIIIGILVVIAIIGLIGTIYNLIVTLTS
jgi:amino acid permease